MIDGSRWWDHGSCTTTEFKDAARKAGAWRSPSDVFFPITETDDGRPIKKAQSPAKYAARQKVYDQLARRTCGECPVRKQCLLDACSNDNETPYGFTGGLTAKQRIDLLDGADLVSKPCPNCDVMLWGTSNIPPPKRCSTLCK